MDHLREGALAYFFLALNGKELPAVFYTLDETGREAMREEFLDFFLLGLHLGRMEKGMTK